MTYTLWSSNFAPRYIILSNTETYTWASLVALMIICLQCRRPRFYPWVGMIPWRREWLSTPIFHILVQILPLPKLLLSFPYRCCCQRGSQVNFLHANLWVSECFLVDSRKLVPEIQQKQPSHNKEDPPPAENWEPLGSDKGIVIKTFTSGQEYAVQYHALWKVWVK